ncbi:TonB-dependent receptor [Novosphingobium flavum]|uniref:TonB-dependent receptor n=1 Tax=Novosphingobium flavum TaxID=1778672 RepID=A0A7X1FUM8_9SPHN|nr:TonB-dependent receptor [Novosphingobium flavum]MBC2667309.1 TonB-dependent receptor [Novosphingobium flavum]
MKRSSSFLPAIAGAALAAGLSMAFAAPAHASANDAAANDAAASDDAAGLTDIVVTAQKREENLQETPISISVLSGEQMANRHVTSLLDLTDGSIPSLRVAPFFSRPTALIVNIRGIGVLGDSNQPARDQGVGIYVDGIYLGRAQGLGTALFDIQSVEVLKGPQGTLFGRNTEGGAVNITTRKPSGEYHLNATAGVGNYGSYKGEMHLDLPEIAGISFKLDAVAGKRDPFVTNPLPGAEGFNSYDKQGLHVAALWQPAAGFSALYSFDVSRDSTTPLYYQLLAKGSNTQAVLGTLQPARAEVANVGVPQMRNIGRTHGHALTLEFDPSPDLKLKSITSYRELAQAQFDNGSAASSMSNATGVFTGVGFSRYSLAQFRQNQASQEFEAIGTLPNLDYVVGAMWYQERVEDNAQAYNTAQFTNADGSAYSVLTLDPATQAIDRASHVTATSIGLFGQATWTPAMLDERIHLTGGLRWTRDAKHGTLFIVNNALPVDRNNVSRPIPLDAAWSRVDPMVNLSFDASRDLHFYGKWSTGYKSGGANSRSQEYDRFNPEEVSIFEIGAKTEFWDRRARFNVAGYAGTYKNIQVDFIRPYETGGLRTTRTTLSTVNAPGTGGVHGVEAELTLAPVDGLTLSASYAHTYVHIPAAVNPYPNAAGVTSTVAVPVYATYTPSDAASGSVDYEVPLRGMTLRAHLDANYDSGYYVSAADPKYVGPGDPTNIYQPKGDKSFVVNGRLALADIRTGANAKAAIALWARNLFNEQHVFYRSLSPTSGMQGFFNEPRTWGVELNVKM